MTVRVQTFGCRLNILESAVIDGHLRAAAGQVGDHLAVVVADHQAADPARARLRRALLQARHMRRPHLRM